MRWSMPLTEQIKKPKMAFAASSPLQTIFLELASEARVALVSYLDNARHLQTDALERQSQILFSLTLFLITLLIGMTLIGTCAILLLRREVALRHGREQAERPCRLSGSFRSTNGPPQTGKSSKNILMINSLRLRRCPCFSSIWMISKGSMIPTVIAAGDAVLRRFAERLSKRVTSYNGLAARLGGGRVCSNPASNRSSDLAPFLRRVRSRYGKANSM